jgi:hypothetical protein
MIFYNAKVKAVKADLAKGEITVTLTMSINDEHMQEASVLAAAYTGEDAGDVEVHILPRQMTLFDSLPEQKELPTDADPETGSSYSESVFPTLTEVNEETGELVTTVLPLPTDAEQSTGEEESDMESEEQGAIETDYETDTQQESEEEEDDEPIP